MRRLLAIAVLVGSLAACSSSSGSPAPAPTVRAVAGHDCIQTEPTAKPVYFGATKDNQPGVFALAGLMFGSGTTGIVFAHEFGGDSCDWAPVAHQLALKGYRTLVFDFNGNGASVATDHPYAQDVQDAVTYLGTQGVTSVVLVGSSMGGTTVLAAAPQVKMPLDGVIALSAPATMQGSDGTAGAAAIKVPLLLMCGTLDSTIIDDVKSEYFFARSTTKKQLVTVETAVHGKYLYLDKVPAVVTAFDAFLAKYAPV